jgi:hypothetical protein
MAQHDRFSGTYFESELHLALPQYVEKPGAVDSVCSEIIWQEDV